jgi:hypothetical protein
MSGSGRKTFVAGEVLLAQELNDYLMDQSVMNFASEAARGSAIPTPTEGMLALTLDTDEIDYYNGSAWVPALPIGAWTAYTPTFTGVNTTGGTTSFWYSQIGKTVFVKGKFTLGAGSGITGAVTATLPVTARTNITNFQQLGTCSLFNTSLLYFGQAFYSSGAVGIQATSASGTYATGVTLSSSVPFMWAATHSFTVECTYEAA